MWEGKWSENNKDWSDSDLYHISAWLNTRRLWLSGLKNPSVSPTLLLASDNVIFHWWGGWSFIKEISHTHLVSGFFVIRPRESNINSTEYQSQKKGKWPRTKWKSFIKNPQNIPPTPGRRVSSCMQIIWKLGSPQFSWITKKPTFSCFVNYIF